MNKETFARFQPIIKKKKKSHIGENHEIQLQVEVRGLGFPASVSGDLGWCHVPVEELGVHNRRGCEEERKPLHRRHLLCHRFSDTGETHASWVGNGSRSISLTALATQPPVWAIPAQVIFLERDSLP